MTTFISTAYSMKVCRSYYIQNYISFSLAQSRNALKVMLWKLSDFKFPKVKHWTSYRHPKRSNAFMPVSKAKAFGNKDTSKLACMFQQGMENISSILPQSFYGVERAQGQ